eukprot:COSAG02_NODE_1568_length_11897_cov_632.076454_11_plen_585_part_00
MPACSFGVFREQTKVRRPRSSLAHGIDRWENSGGRKGSTVWPADAPRLRCQYGKVTRDGRPPLKYHEYTFIQPQEPGDPNSHLPPMVLQRHLYMVLTAAGRKDMSQKRSSLNDEPNGATPSQQQATPQPHQFNLHNSKKGPALLLDGNIKPVVSIKKLPALAAAEASASDGALTLDVVTTLMLEVASQRDAVIGRGRPRLLGEKFCPIAIEIGPSCRRFRRTEAGKAAPMMDRWVNAGGKRAVVIAKSTQEGAPPLQRRNGKIIRPNLPELRYHQFNLGSGARTAETITVYHIFSPLGVQAAAPTVGRSQKSPTEANHSDDAEALTNSEDESEHPPRRNSRRGHPKKNGSDHNAHRLSTDEFVTQRAEERACERHISQAAAKLAQHQLQQHLQQQQQQQQYHFQQQLMQQQQHYQVPASHWPRMRPANIGQEEPDAKRQCASLGQADEDERESAGLLLGLLMDSSTEDATSRQPQPQPQSQPQPQPMQQQPQPIQQQLHPMQQQPHPMQQSHPMQQQQPHPLHQPQLHALAQPMTYERCSDMHATPEGILRVPLAGMAGVSAVNPMPRSASALAADDHSYEGLV